MDGCFFTDDYGTFSLKRAENYSGLYFPAAAENSVKSAFTPNLCGDAKLSQSQFLLQPVSAEDLHNNRSTRNFWCCLDAPEGRRLWSAAGVSAEAENNKFTSAQEESILTAGQLWQKTVRTDRITGLTAEITSFVPSVPAFSGTAEIMLVTLTNQGSAPLSLTPAAAVPIYGRSADNLRDHRHVTSLLQRILTTENGVIAAPALTFDERGHRRNFTAYYICGAEGDGTAPEGFYPIQEDFLGEGGTFLRPRALLENRELTPEGFYAEGREAMGGIVFHPVNLAPGENASYIILLGIAEMPEAAVSAETFSPLRVLEYGSRHSAAAISLFGSLSGARSALEETQNWWHDKMNILCRTEDPDFGRFLRWVSIQPILRRIYGCSFLPHHDYGKGGRGWRDLWQDCLALLLMDPSGVKEMLISNFAGVRIDGTNATIIGSRPGEFIADRNSITRVWMDHGFWPLLTMNFYIQQTGDLDILLKDCPYFHDRQIRRGQDSDPLWNADKASVLTDADGRVYRGTILEHLLLENLTAFYEVGAHNLIRLRDADWNDALDMASENGESAAFTAAYGQNLLTLADLLEALSSRMGLGTLEIAAEIKTLLCDNEALYENISGKQALLSGYLDTCSSPLSGKTVSLAVLPTSVTLRKMGNWTLRHLRENEWISQGDLGWFNGYYDNHGRPLESAGEHPRMLLTSQVFTVMSGAADASRLTAIVRSADRYLYDPALGGYRLNTDFGEIKLDMGRMFGFAYGHKENGAVFSHMAVMYAYALYSRGFAAEGYRALHALYAQSMDFSKSRIYPGIPEYFNDRGRGMYHYLTGAASWYLLTVVTQMFGVRGEFGNLRLRPQLLAEQFDENGQAELSLCFAGRQWKIIYINKNRSDYGQYHVGSVWVDGRDSSGEDPALIPSSRIRTMDKNTPHEIIVLLLPG